MSDRTITRYRSEPTDRRLGRHVRHDSESRRYAFPTAGLSIVSAKHTRRIPILNQGNVGACTAFAGIGCLGTEPFWAPDSLLSFSDRRRAYTLDGPGAYQLYRDVTRADDYPGSWEPDDTGSDGLTIGKVLKTAGEISGYQWTFSLDAALRALGVTPFITGTDWMSGMFSPDPDGRVRITGSVEGGHEYVADEIDAQLERVWFTNSWGSSFGVGGRFYLTFADYGTLLSRQGDVTIFVPLSEPPPVPTPVPPDPVDAALAAALRRNRWVDRWHWSRGSRAVARAAKPWLDVKGL